MYNTASPALYIIILQRYSPRVQYNIYIEDMIYNMRILVDIIPLAIELMGGQTRG